MGSCLLREVAVGASYQAAPPNPPRNRMGINHNRFKPLYLMRPCKARWNKVAPR